MGCVGSPGCGHSAQRSLSRKGLWCSTMMGSRGPSPVSCFEGLGWEEVYHFRVGRRSRIKFSLSRLTCESEKTLA